MVASCSWECRGVGPPIAVRAITEVAQAGVVVGEILVDVVGELLATRTVSASPRVAGVGRPGLTVSVATDTGEVHRPCAGQQPQSARRRSLW